MLQWLRTACDLTYFAKLGVPVFLNKHNELCLNREVGVNADPVIVVSVPKSGTYLFNEVVSALGVQRLDIHIDVLGFMDLRYCTTEFAIGHDVETFVKAPCDRVLPLVQPGQFLLSHFHCKPEIIAKLRRFKIIFTCRDLRDVFVSIARYVAKQRQVGGKPAEGWEHLSDGPEKMEKFIDRYGDHYLGYIKKMRDWAVQPGVLSVTFEEIQGDFGPHRQTQSLRRLADFLGIQRTDAELGQVLQQCLGKKTITFSGKRSTRESLWSKRVEDFFVSNGGEEIGKFWVEHVEGLRLRKCAG